MSQPPRLEPLAAVTTLEEKDDGDKNKEHSEKEHERVNSPSTDSSSGSQTEAGTVSPQENTGSSPPKLKWYRRLNPLRLRTPPPVPKERITSRERDAGILSVMTFQWMSPLMMTGYLRPLQLQDIWLVNPDRSVEVLVPKLQASFKKGVERGDRHPLPWACYETLKFEFWLGALCQAMASVLTVLTPYITKYLIAFATDAYVAKVRELPAPRINEGIGLAIGITLMQIMHTLCTSQFFFRGMMMGGQCRAALIDIIFEKALRLSGRAKAGGKAIEPGQATEQSKDELQNARDAILKDASTSDKQKKRGGKPGPQVAQGATVGVAGDGTGWSNGRIVTLMSIDADRIDKALGLFHLIWTCPIVLILALILLLINIGYSALAGFALVVFGIPLLTIAIKSLIRRRIGINKITDQRVSLTQEILQAVRFVKFFGWEKSFLERLNGIRTREIRAIQIVLAIRNGILCVAVALPTFASMLAFITYSLTNHQLVPAPIFSSLAIFNTLRGPLNMLPLVIGQVTDAWTALCRIQDFLLAEEQSDDIQWDESMEKAISVDHASFTWERVTTNEEEKGEKGKKDKKQSKNKLNVKSRIADEKDAQSDAQNTFEPFKLTDLTFTAGRDELIAVIGTVGCGKTSLLAALAGDMRLTDGEASMSVSRAFCPQYAWIQNTTVRENILFGKEYDEVWYNQVVDACALRADLDMLPSGDATEIGERGITISGGQKQRLNIARAIYFNSSLVLMDDPLSAVDAHVGRHIMDNAICGLLKGKCRILATHQLHVLSRCDRIILLDEGRIETVDTYDNLMSDSEVFQRLMATTAQEEDEEEEGEKGEDEDAEEIDDIEPEAKDPKQKRHSSKPTAALMQNEERAVSSVSWRVWGAYIAAFGHWCIDLPLIVVGLILSITSGIMNGLWLSYWTSNKYGLTEGVYIGVYIALGLGQAIFMFLFSVSLTTSGTNSSKAMLSRAMSRVLRAPMSFFDTTPLGRIINRFSKDVHTMDNDLTDAMRTFYMTIALIFGVIILIIVYYPFFAVALVPLYILFLLSTNFYRASAREIKRHEAVLRSVVFSQFNEAISGTASIRAYGLEAHFTKRIQAAIDNMDSAYFLTYSNQRWLNVRLDAVGWLMIFVTGILVVTSRFDVDPSISGLVLSYILSIAQMLQFTIRQMAEVENGMNSTERLHYYGTQLEEEAPLHLQKVDDSWPSSGQISFSDVKMRYRQGLPLVLQGLSMDVRGGERIGIVGRTGAGKSSIMYALFRLSELSGGSIKIDDVDIATVGLHDLRSRLAIIPQDPALFRGTIRSNLDPFNEHVDLELWSALRQSRLLEETATPDSTSDAESPTSSSTPSDQAQNQAQSQSQSQSQSRIHLDAVVEEDGLNFSLGQRQLMALARALIRNSRIIVCDEATSSVDFETDQKIQETMAQGFKGKTLLCIAHRLRTIINYDRICVMDKGQIAELDTPVNLWEAGGIFRGMCERSGITREDLL